MVCFRKPALLVLISFLLALSILPLTPAFTQDRWIDQADITWDSQSRNASESMPCGGGDIGLNVWVENGDILFYVARSGTFDENNALLKLGRVRIKMSPNP